TGGVKSWSVLSALQDDLGMKVVVTGVKKSTPEDKQRIKMITGDDIQMIDNGNPENLIRLCDTYNVDVLVAGGRNMYTALKARIPFLHINQEREHPYAGYEGMLVLAKELDRTINNPLWNVIDEPAPWELSEEEV
ncbi:MAG: nitrogenase iron-molybdenum cofactor biosynthesis protein NifE, partial [Gammaproteobacteria bacterium]